MRRSLFTSLAAALGLVIACGAKDDVTVGVRSDGVTVICVDGEYYYECTPENAPPQADEGSGSGDGSGSGSDSDGEGSGSGSDDGGGSGSDTGCNFDCPDGGGGDGGSGDGGGGAECDPWPAGTATVLWPPNHKLHTYTLADCANVDVCPNGTAIAAGTVTKITVDEEIDVGRGGDGHTTDYDAAILDATHFDLRSERQGGSDGRVYTVYYVDGNGDAGSCQFLVPHNRGPHEGAVDSGTKVQIVP